MRKAIPAVFLLLNAVNTDSLYSNFKGEQFQIVSNANVMLPSQSQYTLMAKGSNGRVRYTIQSAPNGFQINGSTITIGKNVAPGTYSLKVRADDQSGQKVYKIINLTVISRQGQNQKVQINGLSSMLSNLKGASTQDVQNSNSQYWSLNQADLTNSIQTAPSSQQKFVSTVSFIKNTQNKQNTNNQGSILNNAQTNYSNENTNNDYRYQVNQDTSSEDYPRVTIPDNPRLKSLLQTYVPKKKQNGDSSANTEFPELPKNLDSLLIKNAIVNNSQGGVGTTTTTALNTGVSKPSSIDAVASSIGNPTNSRITINNGNTSSINFINSNINANPVNAVITNPTSSINNNNNNFNGNINLNGNSVRTNPNTADSTFMASIPKNNLINTVASKLLQTNNVNRPVTSTINSIYQPKPSTRSPSLPTINFPSAPSAPSTVSTVSSISPVSPSPSVPSAPNTYPSPSLPQASPGSFNPTLLKIQTQNAIPSIANRNLIAPDQVILNTASNRHQIAIQGVTNLVKILDQSRANRDKAQGDIQTYTQAYNDAVSIQRDAQNQINTLQNKNSQMTTSINDLTQIVAQLKQKITSNEQKSVANTSTKDSIITTISASQTKKAALMQQLKGMDKKIAQNMKQLSDKKEECQQISASVNSTTAALNKVQTQFNGIDGNKKALQKQINMKNDLVNELRKQLQEAEGQLTNNKIRLAQIQARIKILPSLIETLKSEQESLRARTKKCQQQVQKIQKTIQNLKNTNVAEITKQISDMNLKITGNRQRVTEIDGQLANSTGPLEDLKAKLARAGEDLIFLKEEKRDNDQELRKMYLNGNDVNNRVAYAKQNLDAIVKRFQDQSRIVSVATLNLERARAEEALARQGVQELISERTDALPYAIVPNGNLQTDPGYPYGNNPSGSPLGPIKTDGYGAPGSFRVNSWTNYLSAAYGAGVNPAITGSVNQLFPFNYLSNVQGNMVNNEYSLSSNNYNIGNVNGQMNEFNYDQNNYYDMINQYGFGVKTQCLGKNSNSAQRTVTGIISSLGDNGFNLNTADGQIYTVNITPCTQMNANVNNYRMQIGHQAVVKGNQANGWGNIINGNQITCIQQQFY